MGFALRCIVTKLGTIAKQRRVLRADSNDITTFVILSSCRSVVLSSVTPTLCAARLFNFALLGKIAVTQFDRHLTFLLFDMLRKKTYD